MLNRLLLVAVTVVAVFGAALSLHTPVGRALAQPLRAAQCSDTCDDQQAALSAVLQDTHGIVRQQGQSCSDDNPERRTCIYPRADADLVHRGLFLFGMGDPSGEGGAMVAYGHAADGSWGLYVGYQNTIYNLLALPGPAVVCADGDGVNVRDTPSQDSSRVLTVLPDGTRLQVEQFVLSRVLDPQDTQHTSGAGWYRISGPVSGWVWSEDISALDLQDPAGGPECLIRNGQVHFGQ